MQDFAHDPVALISLKEELCVGRAFQDDELLGLGHFVEIALKVGSA